MIFFKTTSAPESAPFKYPKIEGYKNIRFAKPWYYAHQKIKNIRLDFKVIRITY